MVFHGPFAQDQSLGDLAVGFPLRQIARHLTLTSGESSEFFCLVLAPRQLAFFWKGFKGGVDEIGQQRLV